MYKKSNFPVKYQIFTMMIGDGNVDTCQVRKLRDVLLLLITSLNRKGKLQLPLARIMTENFPVFSLWLQIIRQTWSVSLLFKTWKEYHFQKITFCSNSWRCLKCSDVYHKCWLYLPSMVSVFRGSAIWSFSSVCFNILKIKRVAGSGF